MCGYRAGVCKQSLANKPQLLQAGALTDNSGAFAYCTRTGHLRVGGRERVSDSGSPMAAAESEDVIGLLLNLRGKSSSTLSVYKQNRTSWASGKTGIQLNATLLGTVKCLPGPVCWMVTTMASNDMVQIGGTLLAPLHPTCIPPLLLHSAMRCGRGSAWLHVIMCPI